MNCAVARSIYYYTDSRELGGAEISLLMLLGGLDRDRWTPTLLLDDDSGADLLAERAAGLDTAVRRVAPMPLGLAGARRAAGLARRLRRERPAVFHAHMSWPLAGKWPLAAAVVSRVPSVGTVQLIPEFELERSSYRQLRALARGVGRYAAVSRDIAAELVERFHWPPDKIEIVYNAVRLERFQAPAPPGLREELAGGRPLVLTCARLDEQKGHDVLLHAATELPGVAFAFAGDGPLRAELEALASGLGLGDRVRFLGRRDDVPALLAACDVFALPSLYEGSSLAVLEAMAARRAVVSSAIGGTEELIEDGHSGLLVPPGDSEALRSALGRALGDADLREALAGAARERVERDFTPEAMVGANERIYGELLGDGRA
jgi:glycosyltransferase involved in cell wall biosynthesis